jgi:hypothetical protein
MRLLHPSNPLRKRIPDEQYREEADAAESAGFALSVFSLEDFQDGSFRAVPECEPGSEILYRGWMLNAADYSTLAAAVSQLGAKLKVSAQQYLAHHHLPNWYPIIADLTPETKVLGVGSDLESELRSLGWDGFFIKDYVKSLKTSVGSKIADPSQIGMVVAEMQRFRGTIEGGICVRKLEDFAPETERRYFAINAKAYSEDGSVPGIVEDCARRFPTDFISIDAIQRRDGILRIVEIGDGQVSDLVGWTPRRFTEVVKEAWGK